ncbi:hypothetical protein LZ554_005659 [Drepanopeziza brunnea f. sp. 'monogermtubi']|nr:hypothetical protein LZ554_005659 [Drepanopeziza brunnea f. sp. 'monogermtubi']
MTGEDLTDDYVASLLAKDAKESSIKYSSVGLEAFGRSKPPANKPKPNTRFLRNIIKDTDSHNAALLAKEAAESRARLKSLAPSVTYREKPVAGADIRRRQLGDIAAILGGGSTKRKREECGNREGRTVNTSSEDDEKPRNYDSDPLDDIIGPRLPPIPEVKRKGRGIISQSSGIDSRFSANYDPSADVQLDFDEENDWDQALEALRDRTKWKQQGADRLRAAGFTDEEVSKWERGGEKREEDVKWSKKGEGREWDRGKIVNESGVISIQAKFGESTFGRLS